MSNQSPTASFEEFSEWINEVLKNLYDSVYLQSHPLTEVLVSSTTDTAHRSQTLRRIMLEAIRTLYPQGQVSTQSPDWRSYKILELRYVQGLNWVEVMDKLGLSKSHYYRTHTLALEAVAQMLWEKSHHPPPELQEISEPEIKTRVDEAQIDIKHLIAQADWQAINITAILDKLKPVIIPLAQAKMVDLIFEINRPFTILHADRVMLRQAILNILTYALDIGAGGRVTVTDTVSNREAGLSLQVWRGDSQIQLLPTRPRQGLGLEIGEQLLQEMRGLLAINTEGENYWQARLIWSTSKCGMLLVVDDNAGLVDLFRRYLAGTPWQIIGAVNGIEARQQIEAKQPDIIILDVMMPGEDGWELLTDFKDRDDLQNTPIIICSVLNEPQLAQNLGATAYLPKPVTHQALLRLLRPWSQVGATLD